MNATTPAAALADPKHSATFQLLDLGAISLSDTPMQKMRRQRFSKPDLQELAASIKAQGVLQPVLVRLKTGKTNQYELVAGERRIIASKIADQKQIPAMLRTLTDLQVIEMQVIENNQREGLHDLVEAEGFDQLRKPPHNLTADQIADKVGRSRRYVFNRLALCNLCPEAKTAFYDEKISATVAYQIARIAHHDTQRAALKELKPRYDGSLASARDAQRIISDRFMLQLKDAGFPTADATLCPKAGSCAACPKRTGNQPELFEDVKGADVCTDVKCFHEKIAAHSERRRAEAKKAGQTIIAGAEAKKMMPYRSCGIQGAVQPNDTCYSDDKHRTYKQLLGKDAPPLQLLENPHDKTLIEVWPDNVVKKLITHKLPKQTRAASGSGSGHADTMKINQRTVDAMLQAARKKHPGTFGQRELVALAGMALETLSTDNEVIALWQLPAGYTQQRQAIAKLSAKDLVRLIVDVLLLELLQPLGYGQNIDKAGAAWLKSLRIDPKKIKADTAKAYRAEKAAKAKAKTKTPAKAAAKKPAAKK